MKMNVTNKQERFELGDIIELRGNFTEIIREEEVGYECDAYRTTDKTMTFDKMHKMVMAEQAQKNLDDTDWVENQLIRIERIHGKTSDVYQALEAKRMPLLLQREDWVEQVRVAE